MGTVLSTYQQGKELFKQEHYSDAFLIFRALVYENKDIEMTIKAFYMLGKILIIYERYEDALKMLSVPANVDSEIRQGKALYLKGWCFIKMGRFESAIEFLQAAFFNSKMQKHQEEINVFIKGMYNHIGSELWP